MKNLLKTSEYRRKAKLSLIPENVRQSWYQSAATKFPNFQHCSNFWPFEEALRQYMRGRDKTNYFTIITILTTKYIYFLTTKYIYFLTAYYKRHQTQKKADATHRRIEKAEKEG